MFRFCSLASGSRGNAAIVQAEGCTVLIDLGISYSKLSARLEALSISPQALNAVLITHAHSDHVQGLEMLMKKQTVPVYMKEHTYDVLVRKRGYNIPREGITFIDQDHLHVGPFAIQVFRLPHQGWLESGADDPGAHVGFKFTCQNKTLGFFTDLGRMPDEVYPHIHDCDYYVLEANHDVLWQKMSKRPQGVIERNLKSFGHLSNHQAGEILTKILRPRRADRRTKGVMLAHLSRDCNNPIIAEDTILKAFTLNGVDPVEISYAPPERASCVVVI